jgi:hypothetical protein
MLYEISIYVALIGWVLLIVALWVLFRHLTDKFLNWLVSCKNKGYTQQTEKSANNPYNPKNNYNG